MVSKPHHAIHSYSFDPQHSLRGHPPYIFCAAGTLLAEAAGRASLHSKPSWHRAPTGLEGRNPPHCNCEANLLQALDRFGTCRLSCGPTLRCQCTTAQNEQQRWKHGKGYQKKSVTGYHVCLVTEKSMPKAAERSNRPRVRILSQSNVCAMACLMSRKVAPSCTPILRVECSTARRTRIPPRLGRRGAIHATQWSTSQKWTTCFKPHSHLHQDASENLGPVVFPSTSGQLEHIMIKAVFNARRCGL